MNNDPHIIIDKELRRDIDAIIQRLKSSMEDKPNGNQNCRFSRERSLAVTKLQEAVMWMHADLEDCQKEALPPQ